MSQPPKIRKAKPEPPARRKRRPWSRADRLAIIALGLAVILGWAIFRADRTTPVATYVLEEGVLWADMQDGTRRGVSLPGRPRRMIMHQLDIDDEPEAIVSCDVPGSDPDAPDFDVVIVDRRRGAFGSVFRNQVIGTVRSASVIRRVDGESGKAMDIQHMSVHEVNREPWVFVTMRTANAPCSLHVFPLNGDPVEDRDQAGNDVEGHNYLLAETPSLVHRGGIIDMRILGDYIVATVWTNFAHRNNEGYRGFFVMRFNRLDGCYQTRVWDGEDTAEEFLAEHFEAYYSFGRAYSESKRYVLGFGSCTKKKVQLDDGRGDTRVIVALDAAGELSIRFVGRELPPLRSYEHLLEPLHDYWVEYVCAKTAEETDHKLVASQGGLKMFHITPSGNLTSYELDERDSLRAWFAFARSLGVDFPK